MRVKPHGTHGPLRRRTGMQRRTGAMQSGRAPYGDGAFLSTRRIAGEPAPQMRRPRQQGRPIARAGARREPVDEQVELVEDGCAVAATGNRRGRDGRAHAHLDGAANLVAELAHQERQAQRLAVAADEMERRRVLTLEEHRQHSGARLQYEAHRELPPWALLGLAEGVLGRCDRARWEDDDRAARLEEPARLGAGFEVGRERLLGLGEVDGQPHAAQLRQAHELGGEQDAIGPAEPLRQSKGGNAVGDAERMVGNDDQRARGNRGVPVAAGIDLEPRADEMERLAPHARALAGEVGAPALVDRQEPATSRKVLHRPHQPAPDERVLRPGVAQVIGDEARPVAAAGMARPAPHDAPAPLQERPQRAHG
jgi:hypothetical protein